MIFELFCIDQRGKVAFDEVPNFIDALTFNKGLWNDTPEKHVEQSLIREGSTMVKIDSLDTQNLAADLFSSAFLIRVEGEYERLEPMRVLLIQHLRNLGFAHIRILSDDVSAHISNQIYPLVFRIENRLRRFVVKFFITKIGLSWFDISVPREVKDKVKIRKENEPVLTKTGLVDSDVGLIDFNELGEIITRQTSVYSKVEDVVERIASATSLEELRNEVTGHYPKYFKDIFEKKNFESKWKTLFEIRNKVAHCNYVFERDLQQVIELTEELDGIFADAESKFDEAILSKIELQAISKALTEVAEQEAIETDLDEDESAERSGQKRYESSRDRYRSFQDTFLKELRYFEQEMMKPNWDFIALSKFLDYLEDRGYSRHLAASVAKILDDADKIAIEYKDNPHGFYKVASVRLL